MTREDQLLNKSEIIPNRTAVLSMAREAGMNVVDDQYSLLPFLERFAALIASRVAAASASVEREARIEAQKRIEALQAENVSNEANRLAAVLNEREACAKVCEAWSGWSGEGLKTVAKAIRARGQA